MSTLLTDEVWTRLDPHAGRLTRRAALRMWLAVLALGMVAATGLFVWRSGLVVPRVERDKFAGGFVASVEAGAFEVGIPLFNDGQLTETVLAVGRSGPGLALQPSTATYPMSLPPHTGVTVRLRYRVTGCLDVPAGDWRIPVLVSRPWGTVTIHVTGPSLPSTLDSAAGPGEQPWQEALAAQACAVRTYRHG